MYKQKNWNWLIRPKAGSLKRWKQQVNHWESWLFRKQRKSTHHWDLSKGHKRSSGNINKCYNSLMLPHLEKKNLKTKTSLKQHIANTDSVKRKQFVRFGAASWCLPHLPSPASVLRQPSRGGPHQDCDLTFIWSMEGWGPSAWSRVTD